jgi:hypothetical protein
MRAVVLVWLVWAVWLLSGCQPLHIETLLVQVCDGGNVSITIDGSKKIVTDHPTLSIPLIPGL